jgi:DNA-binding transcriptional MerR regulator/effector-binding domain-containing protein
MTDEHLLRIGAFSRAASLSVKALRFYHEIGLLVPDTVDPLTGYRSYSTGQLLDAAVVRRLRELDVGLDDIRTVLDARDPEVTRKVLDQHRAVLQAQVMSLQDALDELYAGRSTPALLTGVHERHEPARTVLELPGRMTPDSLFPFITHAVGVLTDAATASGAVVCGPLGGCYPTQVDDEQEVQVFLPVSGARLLDPAARAAGVRSSVLPAVDAAVVLLHGSYELLEEMYRELGVWVAAHGEPSEGPVREHYLVSPLDTDEPDRWRTEIVWPLRTGGLR